MRVSTSQIFDSGTRGILRNQAEVLNSQNHISANKRVLVPSDDPVAAAQALVVTQSDGVNTQYIANQGTAKDQLSLLESKLGDAVDTTQNILEKVVAAGNGSYTNADRKSVATELRQRLAQLISTANSQDGSGNYMFAGYKTNVQPFASTDPTSADSGTPGPYGSIPIAPSLTPNPYVTYSGDLGQRELQVDASRTMAISANGNDVFMHVTDSTGTSTNASVFDSLKNVIDALETPIDGNAAAKAAFQTAYSTGLGELQSFLSSVGQVRSSVGARLSELDSLGTAASGLSIQYQQTLSNLQDLDYVSAFTKYTQQQVQLQAAQQSFVKISGLSLFNYL